MVTDNRYKFVVSTQLKNISQNGSSPQLGVNIKKQNETTT